MMNMRGLDTRLPRRSPLALALVLGVAVPVLLSIAWGQSENLLDRISNKRMQAFEERLTGQINGALARYVTNRQYVLSVKIIWNRNVIPAVDSPELAPTRQKLPGIPIFVRAPDAPEMDEGAPPFVRMVVQVLLDETLPEYYERFVRKLIPIVARFDARRGDQVVVLKETFPALPEGEQPPTLPEKELMEQLGEQTPRQLPGGGLQPPVPGMQPGMAFQPGIALQPGIQQQPVAGPRAMSPVQAAQLAYDEKRYTDALRIIQNGFQQSTNNAQRSMYLGMEGSLFFTMKNKAAARASWKRAIVFDPGNVEIHRVLNYLDTSEAADSQ